MQQKWEQDVGNPRATKEPPPPSLLNPRPQAAFVLLPKYSTALLLGEVLMDVPDLPPLRHALKFIS